MQKGKKESILMYIGFGSGFLVYKEAKKNWVFARIDFQSHSYSFSSYNRYL